MLKRTTRLMALCIMLALALPVLAQGSRPNPTPATVKEPSQGPATTTTTGEIRLWATAALASSEYGTTQWSAMQATGAPNSSGCADQGTAFATRAATNGEYLIVGFDQTIIPTQINVHLVLNPGTITSMSVADSTRENAIIDITNSGNLGSTTCPGIHSVDIINATVPVNSVIINLDQAASGTWTEIDAVELVGYLPGTVPPTTATQTGPTSRATPIPTLPDAIPGIEVNCGNNVSFSNGVEVIVNMRPGFNYTATAIGIGGFDPIIAVIDEYGNTLCNDDEANASRYVADLPTTGPIGASSLSAHKTFSYSGSTIGNVSLVVGSVGSTAGEFLLLVEGLVVTRADGTGDGAGDPFTVNVTPNVVASGVDYTTYMIAVTDVLDTLITTVNSDGRIIRLDDGTAITCDDAGNSSLCFGDSVNLSGYYVSRENGRKLPGGNYDSMLNIPSDVFNVQDGGFLNFRFTSSGQSTLGDYVAAFHLGTVAAGR